MINSSSSSSVSSTCTSSESANATPIDQVFGSVELCEKCSDYVEHVMGEEDLKLDVERFCSECTSKQKSSDGLLSFSTKRKLNHRQKQEAGLVNTEEM